MTYEPSFLRDCLILGGCMLAIAICAYRMGRARGQRQPRIVVVMWPRQSLASTMNAHHEAVGRAAFTTGRN